MILNTRRFKVKKGYLPGLNKDDCLGVNKEDECPTGTDSTSSTSLEYPDHYTFDNLSRYSEFKHGVFTRQGGVSPSPFNFLNVGLSSGDSRENVVENRERILRCISREEKVKQVLYLNQVHGKKIAVVKKKENVSCCSGHSSSAIVTAAAVSAASGISDPNGIDTNRIDADGIITDIEGLVAVIQVADCQAIIIYDPVKKVLANIHSGWRGSVLNIIGTGVNIMKRDFGTDPGDIVAAVSPSLGPCCSEFIHYREEIPRHLWKYQIDNRGNYFDFWQMSRDQFIQEGVRPGNIEIAGVCTSCVSDTFYSYRKEKITGRFAVVAGIGIA